MAGEMKFKENGGVDPVTLKQGFTALEDNTPYAGENINDPAHVVIEREMAALSEKYGWPDEDEPAAGPEGFLDRDLPTAYSRPNRSDTEDRG